MTRARVPVAGGDATDAGGGFTAPAGERAPNSGAHRLAWWIAGQGFDDADTAVAALIAGGVAPAAIDRMLTGELVPVDDGAAAIARFTADAVMPADWDAPGAAWADPPTPRPEGERA